MTIIRFTILTLFLTFILGVIYPLFLYAYGLLLFKNQTDGSPYLNENNVIIGSKYIGIKNIPSGDKFVYFNPRPSFHDYNTNNTGASNFQLQDEKYLSYIRNLIEKFSNLYHVHKSDIPSDMVTYSGSGIDPDISYHNALIQARYLSLYDPINYDKLISIIKSHRNRSLLGDDYININELNVDLYNLLH